jgi:hypothetical protein
LRLFVAKPSLKTLFLSIFDNFHIKNPQCLQGFGRKPSKASKPSKARSRDFSISDSLPRVDEQVVKQRSETRRSKMNLLSKIALLFGRRKFEEFAQANPALPDDALAVANTLDTFPVRGAVTLVAGSLAHALDSVLRGTETIDTAATHALLILAGLCIVWVRHAISKHDVRVNDVVQKARDLSGLSAVADVTSKTLPMIVAFGLGFTLFAVSGVCHAELVEASPTAPETFLATGSSASSNTPTPNSDSVPAVSSVSSAPLDNTFSQLVTDIGKSTKFSSGVGINLHAKIAPLLSQELPLFGHSGTNSSWSTGPSHATFFLPTENEEQLGWSLSGSWQSPPRLLRLALFNASDVDWTVNWGLPVEDYYQLFRHNDWKENRFGLSVTRKF